jgi:hypothetical protein
MRNFANVSARLIAGVLAFVTLAPITHAQNLPFAGTVKVPFAFDTATGQHFGPGVYEMRGTGQSGLLIRSATASGIVLVMESGDSGRIISQGKAVFTHYGDKYYLHSVSVSNSSMKLQFGTSKSEKRAQFASNQPKGSAVELALLETNR